MEYVVHRKLWTFGSDYTVHDSEGVPRYRMVGGFLSGTLVLSDMGGSQHVVVEQDFLSPHYTIKRDGAEIARLTTDFSFWGQSYTMDVPGPNDFSITSVSVFSADLQFARVADGVVARAICEGLLSTSYRLTIEPGQDDLLILAALVALDRLSDD